MERLKAVIVAGEIYDIGIKGIVSLKIKISYHTYCPENLGGVL